MKKMILCFILIISIFSCNKTTVQKTTEAVIKNSSVSGIQEDQIIIAPPLELTFDSLVGKWLFLDSEGRADSSGDYLFIKSDQNSYSGTLKYQRSQAEVTLITEMNRIYVVTERGEYYLVSVVQSMYESKHNGIGLALRVDGYDDISLGIFQHEDVLKRLKN